MAVIVDNDQRAALVSDLEVEAMTTASILASEPESAWQATTEAVAQRTGARVVVVSTDRQLVADSDRSDLERSFDRPEIDAALAGQLSSDVRYSSTLGVDLRYVAAPVVKDESIVAAARLSLPQSQVDAVIQRTRWSLAAFVAAVVVAAALIAWIIAHSIAGPLQRVAEVAEELPDDLEARADEAKGPPEVRVVARTLNRTGERLSRLLRRQQQVAADASHHLRTPLTGVRLRLEAIEETTSNETIRRDAEAAISEVDRLNRRIDQILALARSDAGQGAEAVDAGAVTADRVGQAETAASARNVALVTEVDPRLPAVLAPRGALDRVVDELLGNALSYARSRITVAAHADGDTVRIDVEDDGPGLPEAERERIFDRFTRGSGAVPGGSGLGLALVRESALAAGGDAWIETGHAGGMRVCTLWPAVTRDAGRGPTLR
jgi:signal transduction histidine kinase